MRKLRIRAWVLIALLVAGLTSWGVTLLVQRHSRPVALTTAPRTSVGSLPNRALAGVPAGVALRPYDGPCEITDGATIVIDSSDVRKTCDSLTAYTGRFVITRSLLPRVLVGWPGSASLTDSEVDGGTDNRYSAVASNNENRVPAGSVNLVVRRVDVRRGKDSVECSGACVIEDSYLHDQHSGGGAHVQAFLSSGGSHMVLRGNTLSCTPPPDSSGGACTADLAMFGDASPLDDIIIEGNRFVAGTNFTRCLYGGAQPGKAYPVARRVVVRNNVFERGANGLCGSAGPVASFDRAAPGAEWSGNRWDDGTLLNPPPAD